MITNAISTLTSAAPNSSDPPQAPMVLELQHLQRLCIPTASKEVTSKKREATKENDGHRKKVQAQ
ncbi:hypothetical protein BDZ94DRAFT_1315575 [Collybia nuda]|uniref:Uncharacterized protein n=1 Tax=Collybia nuda TaxID=64659 RepID=A0A9P5XR53_9AGAR|nr:hypothetical protein BDZ94DRAFT_1315575 [Collybia nuda]